MPPWNCTKRSRCPLFVKQKQRSQEKKKNTHFLEWIFSFFLFITDDKLKNLIVTLKIKKNNKKNPNTIQYNTVAEKRPTKENLKREDHTQWGVEI